MLLYTELIIKFDTGIWSKVNIILVQTGQI
jgi:hypothetical protein